MKLNIVGIVALIGIIVVGIIDILTNVLSVIPYIGSALETVCEFFLEIIQMGLAAVLFLLGGKK